MNYSTLANYYSTNFALAQHHKYSIGEIEELIPFERDIYVGMLMKYLDDAKEKARKRG